MMLKQNYKLVFSSGFQLSQIVIKKINNKNITTNCKTTQKRLLIKM